MCGRSFSEGLFSSRRWLDQVTMVGLPDNNADGAEGTIPYKYLYFCRFLEERRGVVVEMVVLECIVSRSV